MNKKQKMRTLWGNPYKDGHPVGWQDTMDKHLLEEELAMGWCVVQMCPLCIAYGCNEQGTGKTKHLWCCGHH